MTAVRSVRARARAAVKRHGSTALIALVVSLATAAAPSVAATVIAYATDAGAVDGYSAAKSTTPVKKRKSTLVATGTNGYLPNNIIKKAADSNKLDGLDSTDFLSTKSKAADSNLLDGLDSSAFLSVSGVAADANKLDGLDSADFLGVSGKAANADKLDGADSTDFLGVSATAANSSLVGGFGPSAFIRPSRVTYVRAGTDANANGDALEATLAAASGAVGTHTLVQLEPGTYDVGTTGLVLPTYVDLAGAGMGATVIRGSGGAAIGSLTAFGTAHPSRVVLAVGGVSEVRDLQVFNNGGTVDDNTARIAIYSNSGSATFRRINANVDGLVYLSETAGDAVGLYVTGSGVTIDDSLLEAHDSGVNSPLASVTTSGVTRVFDSRFISAGTGLRYNGLHASAATIDVYNSYINVVGAQPRGVSIGATGNIHVSGSQIDAPAGAESNGGGTFVCVSTTTTLWTELDATCN